jgi:hypothetical protein
MCSCPAARSPCFENRCPSEEAHPARNLELSQSHRSAMGPHGASRAVSPSRSSTLTSRLLPRPEPLPQNDGVSEPGKPAKGHQPLPHWSLGLGLTSGLGGDRRPPACSPVRDGRRSVWVAREREGYTGVPANYGAERLAGWPGSDGSTNVEGVSTPASGAGCGCGTRAVAPEDPGATPRN